MEHARRVALLTLSIAFALTAAAPATGAPDSATATSYVQTYAPAKRIVLAFGHMNVGTESWTAVIAVPAGLTAIAGMPEGVELTRPWAWAFRHDGTGSVNCRGIANIDPPADDATKLEATLHTSCGTRALRFQGIGGVSQVLGHWRMVDDRLALDMAIPSTASRIFVPDAARLTVCDPMPATCAAGIAGDAAVVDLSETGPITFAFSIA